MRTIDDRTIELVARLLGSAVNSLRSAFEEVDIGDMPTLNEVKEAYFSLGGSGVDKHKQAIRKKWEDMALEISEKSRTWNEVRAAYDVSPWNSEAETVAVRKWLDLCQNTDDVTEIRSHYYHKLRPSGEGNPEAEMLLLKHLLRFLDTFEGLQGIKRWFSTDSAGNALVTRRCYEFALEKVRNAENLYDVLVAYRFFQESADVRRAAAEKLLELFPELVQKGPVLKK